MKYYPFPSDPSKSEFCVFPDDLEHDPLVLFHATPIGNFDAIKTGGFKSAASLGTGILTSVSFAKRSVVALTHAMSMRKDNPGAYCIFAVSYDSLERKGLVDNGVDIHDNSLDPAPKPIGYCIVAAEYHHL